MKSRSPIGAYILIALGIIFLLSNFGLMPAFGQILSRWWPLILIIIGVLGLIRRASR